MNISELISGEWEDRSKEKIADTQKEIVRILGMDSLTFKACVLIMQDQYGIFLEADKPERITVLSNLLGLGVYGVMEDLAGQQLRELKREIATRKTTIEVHSNAIREYGDPQTELSDLEARLKLAQLDSDTLSKKKEDKQLLLRMQREAEERLNKVKASVNTLLQKKAATEQNMNLQTKVIADCDLVLSTEADVMEKVARHNELIERDRELAKAAVAYTAKHEELVRVHNQEMQEEESISKMQEELARKKREIEIISSSGDDDEIKANAAEYEHIKKMLDEAYEEERNYRSTAQRLESVRVERAGICAKFHMRLLRLENTLSL